MNKLFGLAFFIQFLSIFATQDDPVFFKESLNWIIFQKNPSQPNAVLAAKRCNDEQEFYFACTPEKICLDQEQARKLWEKLEREYRNNWAPRQDNQDSDGGQH